MTVSCLSVALVLFLQPTDIAGMLEGEGECYVDRNAAAIVAECKKRQPNRSVLELADKLKCLKPACEVLQSFPSLQQELYVSQVLLHICIVNSHSCGNGAIFML